MSSREKVAEASRHFIPALIGGHRHDIRAIRLAAHMGGFADIEGAARRRPVVKRTGRYGTGPNFDISSGYSSARLLRLKYAGATDLLASQVRLF